MTAAAKSKSKTTVEKLLYRRGEAAHALGMSLRKIDYWIAEKRLTTRRVGRCVVIPAAEVRGLAQEILSHDLL